MIYFNLYVNFICATTTGKTININLYVNSICETTTGNFTYGDNYECIESYILKFKYESKSLPFFLQYIFCINIFKHQIIIKDNFNKFFK